MGVFGWLTLLSSSFTSATERHIEVGDELEVYIVRKGGFAVERFPLKRD